MKEWEGTEAEHLEDSGFSVSMDGEPEELRFDGIERKQFVRRNDGTISQETPVATFGGRVITSERQEEMKRLYEAGKAAKVGSEIVCPVCREKHTKTTYHKVFCSNGRKSKKDCKSKYWNTIHPERLDRLY